MKSQPKKPLRPTMNSEILNDESSLPQQTSKTNGSSQITKGPFSKPGASINQFSASYSNKDEPKTTEQNETPSENESTSNKYEEITKKSNLLKGYTKSLTSQAHSKSLAIN